MRGENPATVTFQRFTKNINILNLAAARACDSNCPPALFEQTIKVPGKIVWKSKSEASVTG
jgi:hypothetical protein